MGRWVRVAIYTLLALVAVVILAWWAMVTAAP